MSRNWIMLVFILALSACQSQQQTQADSTPGMPVQAAGGTYYNLSVDELQVMMEEEDFVFVNVHIPFEGDIPGTDLSIPYDQIDLHLDELPADQNAQIVLYCRSGRMSQIAAETLVRLGYTNVWNLDGGFLAWEQAGLPIEGR